MKYTRIIVTHYGGPDALQVTEEEHPKPNVGGVRVSVLAAGSLSLPDVRARGRTSGNSASAPYVRSGPGRHGVSDRCRCLKQSSRSPVRSSRYCRV